MHARAFSHITAQALVPEQLVSYVTAVAGSRPVLCGGCVAYDYGEQRTLIAYAPGSLPGEDAGAAEAAMNAAVRAALADGGCTALTVLGPARPAAAPPDAAIREDAYFFLPLPLPPGEAGQKLRNMLRRGSRECSVTEERWQEEHTALVGNYLDSRPLEAGMRHIYGRIPAYLASSPEAVLFAARDASSRLLACAVGDFSGLSAAFYMFAFRRPDCPPGVADVLLHAIACRAAERGHQHLNLGLGVNKGIAAFKRKWGASLRLPCVQSSWNPAGLPAAPRAMEDSADPLAVFAPPGFFGHARRFLFGETRPFDCLQIEVSSRCPGKCAYCPHTTKQDVWRSRHMEDASFAALEPLIRRTKRVHLQGWGEPLLHPRFFEYAAAVVRAGSAVSTTTYGLAVSNTNATRLTASGIDIVAFSLTGVDGAGNAARAGVPFEGVRDGILALKRAKRLAGSEYPRIHLAYLMLASEAENVVRLPDLMHSLDVPVAVVSTLDYIAAPGQEAEAYAPHETEKVGRARALLHGAAARAAAMGGAIHYALPGEHGGNDCSERVQTCMYIDADGVIAPCIYLNLPTEEHDPRRRSFGSARERCPLEIWHDPEYARFRQRLASGDPDLSCAACAKRFEKIF
ncbi:MAG: SPASM domain-containing protein [Deltaproteobacteria bacterium]|nr:SPASM domain-containing protein [Deltaproteobacteria bacterium]